MGNPEQQNLFSEQDYLLAELQGLQSFLKVDTESQIIFPDDVDFIIKEVAQSHASKIKHISLGAAANDDSLESPLKSSISDILELAEEHAFRIFAGEDMQVSPAALAMKALNSNIKFAEGREDQFKNKDAFKIIFWNDDSGSLRMTAGHFWAKLKASDIQLTVDLMNQVYGNHFMREGENDIALINKSPGSPSGAIALAA